MNYLVMLSILFGVVGIIANVIIFWQNDSKRLLSAKLFADIVWTTHYSLLCAWTGAVTCGVSIVREIVFLNRKHKWARSKLWLILFCVISISYGIVSWENILNILPICGSLLSVISFAAAKPKLTRILQILISIMFLFYDIYVMSFAGIVNEFFTLTSVMIALIVYQKNA